MIGFLIVLKQDSHLDDILSTLAELEVFDVTVMEGNNLEGILEKDLPLFAGLFSSINRKNLYGEVILGVFRSDSLHHAFNKIIGTKGISFKDPGVGYMASFNLISFAGEELVDN